MSQRLTRWISLILLCLTSSRFVIGNEPATTSLLPLVDGQAGLVIRIQNLKENLPSILDSKWLQDFHHSSIYTALAENGDFKRLVHAGKKIEESSGGSLQEFSNQVFGEDVILAIHPQDETQPYGVLYTVAESEVILMQVISRWKRIEGQTTTLFKHHGIEYNARTPLRTKNPEKSILFYTHFDRVFVISDREQAIQRAIEFHLAATTKNAFSDSLKPLADIRKYTIGREMLPAKFWVSVYFSSPQWKNALTHLRENNTDPGLSLIHSALKKSQAMMLGLRFEEGLLAELLVKMNEETTTALKAFDQVTTTSNSHHLERVTLPCAAIIRLHTPSELLAPFVARELTSRLPDWNHLQHILAGLFLGNDPLAEILPKLGPEWQLCLYPPGEQQAWGYPVSLFFTANYQSAELTSETGVKASLQNCLTNGIDSILHLIAMGEKDKLPRINIDRSTSNGTINWQIRLKEKLALFLGIDAHSFWIGTSPPPPPDVNPANQLIQSSAWKESLFKHGSPQSPFLWIHHPTILALPALQGDAAKDARQWIEMFDVSWLTAHTEQGIIRINAGFQKLPPPTPTAPAQP